jgi:hypothetical protein
MGRVSADAVRAWVETSCLAQGLTVKVADAAVVSRVELLLRGRTGRPASARQGGRSGGGGTSQPPHRYNPGRVQGVGTLDAGVDHSVIEQGADDGVLPGQVQAGPLSA